MILLITVVVVGLLLGFVWFAVRNARAENVWEAVDDAKESGSVQPVVTPPNKPKVKATHA